MTPSVIQVVAATAVFFTVFGCVLGAVVAWWWLTPPPERPLAEPTSHVRRVDRGQLVDWERNGWAT